MANDLKLPPACPDDIPGIIDLYVKTVMTICTSDYNEQQLELWANLGRNHARWERRIASQYFLVAELVIDKKRSYNHLPDSLHLLIPYAKYAVGDDSLRSQLAATLTRTAKDKLITEVGPLLPEINSFLDSFGNGPVSDEAIVMGSLAEFVCELEVDKP